MHWQKAAIEALYAKLDMKASGTGTFVEGMKAKAQEFGWSEGSKQITTFKNDTSKNIDLIECMVKLLQKNSRLILKGSSLE